MISLYKEKGKEWLDRLDLLIEQLSRKWNLTDLKPVENMTYHYVAKATRNRQMVVIKIGLDQDVLNAEIAALKHFNGRGCIRLIDHINGSILLEQAMPGMTLRSLYPQFMEDVMDHYINVVDSLPKVYSNNFQQISDWLKGLDDFKSDRISNDLIQKAIHLKNELLNTMHEPYVIHGDLHLDNILSHQNQWICIDPKGIVGDKSFEMAAFDFISSHEIGDADTMNERILILASKAQIDRERLAQWVYVRLILSAVWFCEDNKDPSWAIQLAHLVK